MPTTTMTTPDTTVQPLGRHITNDGRSNNNSNYGCSSDKDETSVQTVHENVMQCTLYST